MNVLNFVIKVITEITILVYFGLGLLLDMVLKAISFVLCTLIITIATVLLPFIPTRKVLSKIKPFYDYGGRWKFDINNYFIVSVILTRFNNPL